MQKARHISEPSEPVEEINRLKHAIQELSFLNDLARSISVLTDSNKIMKTIIHKSLHAVGAMQGVITLVEKSSEKEQLKTLVRSMVSSSSQTPFHIQQSIVGWMQINKKPLVVTDPKHDERFKGIPWDQTIRTVLCVPMMVKSDLIGVLTMYNKQGDAIFTDDDARYLAIIAMQSAQVVENAQLHEKEKELQHMQAEVRLASKIQMNLLPKAVPSVKGYDIAGSMIAAQVVGGDYYDFIPMDNDRMALCLGDISGKGLPASLLMANLQATLRSQASISASPKECIRRANDLLFRSTADDKFATLFLGVLNTQNHTLTYCNAGQEHPCLFTQDTLCKRLTTGGPMVGAFDGADFAEEIIELHAGDTLVAFSDGYTEAMNKQAEHFTDQRIQQALARALDKSAKEMIEHVVGEIKIHTAGQSQYDDMTMIVIKRLE
jgi:sigma-B regulation protein RsbU (phosphoserine phosphatase)